MSEVEKVEKKETSYELFETLFNKEIFSNAKIKINNVEYHVKKEILQTTSVFFDTYFTTQIGMDENTVILDINDEVADPKLIETMFKVLYTYYGNRCMKFSAVSRENLISKLNVFYVLNFVGFNQLEELKMLNLGTFAQLFKQLYQDLFQIHLQTHVKHTDLPLRYEPSEKEIQKINMYLQIFCNSKDLVSNSFRFRGVSFERDWPKNAFLHIMNPAFPGNLEYPVFQNVEPLERFSLPAFKNLIGLYEDFKILAPLINFSYKSKVESSLEDEASDKKENPSVIESIMKFEDPLPQYLLALYAFTKPKQQVETLQKAEEE